ncbi:endonuclease/exonuclease/phosphatase family protein [Allokutzneria albata]|uniref:Metal-dependent hydrolase, endonuclease/exonuclease/phosphatase family n=1 Tax=Allokutzneria albata TaxID=211114 RepID=A0A1G9UXS3_ALLAB|nr:endonuclease/exonuclease/phosphatase family protein [Allokutzneria albata]SDM64742.1 Metal-dependent hydrolase, endonuclease/exonuclease/phosphatase family [Allokutzneria albata]
MEPKARKVVLVLCAAALVAVFALVVVRMTGLDAGTPLALPVSGLPYAAVGTLVVFPAVLALRARWLTLAAAALVALQVFWLAPRFVADGAEIAADAPRIRVATSNTLRGNVDMRALVELVRTQRVDVLAVQELGPKGVGLLDDAGMRELMPHRELHPEIDTSIYSRLSLTAGGLVNQPTTWPQTTATVVVGGHPVRIVGVHTLWPVEKPAAWTADLRALRAEAGPNVVMLGDFNATLDHTPMRELLAAGLADAHAELGRGWAPTWPADRPVIQIDHVLHGRSLRAVSVSEHTVPGTDHRAVVAELAYQAEGA